MMNDLVTMKLFALWSDISSEATIEEWQTAYEALVERIDKIGRGDDCALAFRSLHAIHIELSAIEAYHPCEQGKKGLCRCAYKRS